MSGFLRKLKRSQDRKSDGRAADHSREMEMDIREAISRLEMDVTMAKATRAWARQRSVSPHQTVIVVARPDHPEALGLDTFDFVLTDRRGNAYGHSRFHLEQAKVFVPGPVKGQLGMAQADALRQGGMKWSVALIGCRNGLWEVVPYRLPTGEKAETAEEAGPDELHEFG